jgi:hypothetical protein
LTDDVYPPTPGKNRNIIENKRLATRNRKQRTYKDLIENTGLKCECPAMAGHPFLLTVSIIAAGKGKDATVKLLVGWELG